MNFITTRVDLDGRDICYHVNHHAIAVRVEDRVCVTHRRWMSTDDARLTIQALTAVIGAQ